MEKLQLRPAEIRVLLMSKAPLIAEGLQLALKADCVCETLSLTNDPKELHTRCASYQPQVVIVHHDRIPGMNGSFARRLRNGWTHLKLMAIIPGHLMWQEDLLLGHGYDAVLPLDTTLAELRRIVSELAEGRQVVHGWRPVLSSGSNEARLTPREVHVVQCMAQGMRSADIARHLQISLATVRTHRKHITQKLGTHTPSELIIAAQGLGIL